MKIVLMILLIVLVFGMVVVGCWLVSDSLNVDYINPEKTDYPNSKIELQAYEANLELQQAKDATGKVAMVAVAGYATIGEIVAMQHFRDIVVVIFVIGGICYMSYLNFQGKRFGKK